jgi:poly(3-hydroxybutyrate) depolymerase
MRCGTPWKTRTGLYPDDIGFARELITALQPRLAFDPKRVFLHGQSAGAHFVHGLGVALSELVAAIAPYAETLYSWHETPTIRCPNIPAPKTPVSALILHGDADVWTKYEGMNTVNPDGTNKGTSNVDDSFEFWAKANGCRSVNTTERLVTGIGGTPTSVDYKHAYDCEGSAEVKIYRLHRGIHFFYPYETRLDRPSEGPYNPNFGPATGVIINDVIWNFFNAHPKR